MQPNFHFGYAESGLCWTSGGISLDDYVALWEKRIADGESTVRRPDWPAYWDELAALKVVNPEDWQMFEAAFTHTGRDYATPRPGLWVRRRWPLAEAETLDAADHFVAEVRETLGAALTACDASINRSAAAIA